MPTFKEIGTKIRLINIYMILQMVIKNADLTNTIIKMITNRLYSEGTTGDGIELQTDRAGNRYPYSYYTVRVKSENSPRRPVDRVTLKQTGEFYESIAIEIQDDGFTIKADFRKTDGHMHKNFQNTFSTSGLFEKSVLSLSKEEFEQIVKRYFLETVPKLIHERITMS